MYNHAITLIGKHLRKYMPSNVELKKKLSTVCAFSGIPISEGVPLKKIIGGQFTDREYIKFDSQYVSLDAYLCFSEILPSGSANENRKNSLRVYNYYVDENELLLLKREELLTHLLKEKKTPFVFCITYNNKKHTSFKAKINYNNDDFIVRTDLSYVSIQKKNLLAVLPILEKWYSVPPGKEKTSMQPTFFSKQEILTGQLNYYKVQEYGEALAFEENEFLSFYRGSLWFELLVHCLNKKIINP